MRNRKYTFKTASPTNLLKEWTGTHLENLPRNYSLLNTYN
jgi:hypothetical protein